MAAVTTRLFACHGGHWRSTGYCGACQSPTVPTCEHCGVSLEHPNHGSH